MAREFFLNTVADAASIPSPEVNDLAYVLLNRPKTLIYVGSPPAWTDAEKVVITPGDVEVGNSDTFPIRTADPASPADDTGWFVRDSASPETLYLRVRRSGVTQSIPLGTL